MSQEVYEIVALGARYLFALLMVVIVARAWRITVIDSRRAQTLRRISPETGISGELVVLEGGDQARRGMKYPVIREGLIGSSRRADIRVRHRSVRRRHAYFQLTPEGLAVRTHAGAALCDGRGRPQKTLTLRDGSQFSVGRVRLMLVLTDTVEGPAPEDRRETFPADRSAGEVWDDWFEADPDRMFDPAPLPGDRVQGEARPMPSRQGGAAQPLPNRREYDVTGGAARPMPNRRENDMAGGGTRPMPNRRENDMAGGGARPLPNRRQSDVAGGVARPVSSRRESDAAGVDAQPLPYQRQSSAAGVDARPLPYQRQGSATGGVARPMPNRRRDMRREDEESW